MNDLLSRVYRGSMGLVQMSGIWCYRIDVKDKTRFCMGKSIYLDCPRKIDDADCSKAQRVDNAWAGRVAQ